MAEVPSSDEIKVVYGSADFRALYRACRSCKRNAILLLLVVPAVFGALSYGDGVRGVRFIEKTVESAASAQKWTAMR